MALLRLYNLSFPIFLFYCVSNFLPVIDYLEDRLFPSPESNLGGWITTPGWVYRGQSKEKKKINYRNNAERNGKGHSSNEIFCGNIAEELHPTLPTFPTPSDPQSVAPPFVLTVRPLGQDGLSKYLETSEIVFTSLFNLKPNQCFVYFYNIRKNIFNLSSKAKMVEKFCLS